MRIIYPLALAAALALTGCETMQTMDVNKLTSLMGNSAQETTSVTNGRTESASGASRNSSVVSDRAVGELVRGIPSDATAKCRDGTFSKAGKRENACTQHNGVAIWYPGS